jgi:HEAT repeat protein
MALSGAPNIEEFKIKRDVEGLIAALQDQDAAKRAAAAEALGEIADPRSVEPLVTAMDNDKAWDVRFHAALALVQMGNVRGVDGLMVNLHGGAHGQIYSVGGKERQTAVSALGKIRDAKVIDLLLDAAQKADPGNCGVLIEGLGELGAQVGDAALAGRVAEALMRRALAKTMGLGLQQDEKEISKALCRIGAPAVEPLLARSSAHPYVARTLGLVGEQLPDTALAERIINALIPLLGECRTAEDAARALGKIAGQHQDIAAETRSRVVAALTESVMTGLQRKLSFDRAQSVQALRGLGDPATTEALLNPLADELFEEAKKLAFVGASDDWSSRYHEVQAYEKVLLLNPRHVRCWTNLAVTRLQMKEWQEALDAFDKALEIDPSFDKALRARYIALWNLGRHNEALDELDRIIATYHDPQLEQTKAQFLRLLGRG